MSRRRKLSKAEKRRRRRKRDNQQFSNVVQDTAGVFTCSSEIANDFQYQCENRLEDLDCDLRYARLAHELWVERPGPTQQIAAALANLVTEYQRHLDALTPLAQRFADLAAAPELQHCHLGPPEAYLDLVWRRIFPDLPPPPSAQSPTPGP